MKQRFFQLLIALLAFVSPILCPGVVFSHEFELGHIERSIDVVVRERMVQVSYAVGLADITMLEWLVREAQLDLEQEQRFRRLIEESESNGENEDGSLQQSGGSPPSSTEAAESETAAAEQVEPAEFQRELADLFKEKLSEKICSNLQLSYDGEVVEFSQQKLVDTARHHVVLEVQLVAEIPRRETGVLRLEDENFLEKVEPETVDETGAELSNPVVKTDSDAASSGETVPQKDADLPLSLFRFDGKVRRACRVKGGAVLVNSNVAAVLARAKVADVAQMNQEQRVLAATIEAKLAFADPEAR